MKYDVAVAYRLYPKISKTPAIFSDDKLKLSDLCLHSFKKSLGSLKAKIWVLLDNCPPEYKEIFLKYFDEKDLVFLDFDGIGNGATFGKQIEILLEQNESDYIYFAEDDYFYLPNSFHKMLNLIKNSTEAHFVTPYDHYDYYTIKFHLNKYKIIVNGNLHWRTVCTTCMTFLTSKKILKETEKIFRTYIRNNYDNSLWMTLTKINIFKPSLYFHGIFRDSSYLIILFKIFYYSFFQVFLTKKYNLFSPMPSIATHLEKDFLAPSIDWNSEFDNLIKEGK